jgi:MoaA/NifB/PqqE/SkfB family radical SAM enzyme
MAPVLDKIRSLTERVFPREAPLPFPDTLNIESSYACNLKCVMCPRHFEGVPQGMFTLDMFEKHIQPHVGRFKYVHLTGWGEPLMNRDLPEIVRRCRAAGCWTCFTTNGLLLRPPLDRTILETGLEMISVSCDADNAKTYEYVRGKGTFDVLVDRLTNFNKLRRELKAPTVMQWSFVQMRHNFEQLPGTIRLAARCGFDQLVAKHIETVIHREELADAMWNTGIAPDLSPELVARHDEVLAESRAVAKEVGINLIIHPRRMSHEGQCIVKPMTNLFVDYQGRVSSCCYLNKNDVRPYNLPEERPRENGVYGELHLTDLMTMLQSESFRQFQREWRDGRVPEPCRNCLQVNRIHSTSTD